MKMHKKIHYGFLVLALATISSIASAKVVYQPWYSQFTLYGWAAGVGGDIKPFSGSQNFSFNKSFPDILKDSDGAFFATGLARKGPLVLLADVSYSSSSRQGSIHPGINAQASLTLRSLTLAAGRRVFSDQGSNIDVLGGFKIWDANGSVEVPFAAVSKSPEKTFIDPIIAMRGKLQIAPRWSLLGYADLGGFGVGSKFTYQLTMTANYQMTRQLYVSVGYRQLYLDYDSGGTRLGCSMRGPLIGVTWRP